MRTFDKGEPSLLFEVDIHVRFPNPEFILSTAAQKADYFGRLLVPEILPTPDYFE